MFSANYLSLLALFLALIILLRGTQLHFGKGVRDGLLALLSCAVIGWGVVEMQGITSQFKQRNIYRDLFMPVAKRLTALAIEHVKGPDDREIVFSRNHLVISDNVAAVAPQIPFWGSYLPPYGSLARDEKQERYLQYLYYSDLGPDSFAWALKNSVMFTVASAFGYERYNPSLVADFHPLTSGEIEDKVRQYEQYVAAFNRERAQQTQISYVVLMADSDVDFTNLDRWYVRDAGEMHGPFILYQVRLR